jgi:hypothetical protein
MINQIVNIRSVMPIPARRIGLRPIRSGMVWPVKDEMGDWSFELVGRVENDLRLGRRLLGAISMLHTGA